MDKFKIIIADNVRKLMADKEFGQEFLAKKLDMSQSNLNQILNGKLRFSNDDLFNLSKILETTIDSFYSSSEGV